MAKISIKNFPLHFPSKNKNWEKYIVHLLCHLENRNWQWCTEVGEEVELVLLTNGMLAPTAKLMITWKTERSARVAKKINKTQNRRGDRVSVILERKDEDSYLGLVVNFMKLINPGVSKECHALVCTEPHQWNLMLHGKLKCLQHVMTCHNTWGKKKNTPINKPPTNWEILNRVFTLTDGRKRLQKKWSCHDNDLKSILPQTQPWDQAVDCEELCLAFHTLVNPAINDHPLLLCWCFFALWLL
jgi:hypothetical protein